MKESSHCSFCGFDTPNNVIQMYLNSIQCSITLMTFWNFLSLLNLFPSVFLGFTIWYPFFEPNIQYQRGSRTPWGQAWLLLALIEQIFARVTSLSSINFFYLDFTVAFVIGKRDINQSKKSKFQNYDFIFICIWRIDGAKYQCYQHTKHTIDFSRSPVSGNLSIISRF